MTAINPFIYLWWAAVGAMLVMKITAYGGAWLPEKFAEAILKFL